MNHPDFPRLEAQLAYHIRQRGATTGDVKRYHVQQVQHLEEEIAATRQGRREWL